MNAFLHGKLPAHGDFISRGLLPELRDALDAWLSNSMGQARADIGDGFEQAWDQAPPWRFAWTEGDRWSSGALAASVDGVGRRFPLMLAISDLTDDQVESTAAAVEGLLYDALAASWDADRLHAVALEIAPVSGQAWSSGDGWWTIDAEGSIAGRLDGARPAGLVTAMLTLGQGNA